MLQVTALKVLLAAGPQEAAESSVLHCSDSTSPSLQLEPMKRLTAEEVLQHPWLVDDEPQGKRVLQPSTNESPARNMSDVSTSGDQQRGAGEAGMTIAAKHRPDAAAAQLMSLLPTHVVCILTAGTSSAAAGSFGSVDLQHGLQSSQQEERQPLQPLQQEERQPLQPLQQQQLPYRQKRKWLGPVQEGPAVCSGLFAARRGLV